MTARMSDSQAKLFSAVCARFRDLGYTQDELLQPNYRYLDYFASDTPLREIPAACFGRLPAAYNTALLGIAAANGLSGRALVDSHRALGAPLILEVDQSHVHVWSLGAGESLTQHKLRLSPEEFGNWAQDHAEGLGPEEFLRTKNIRRGETEFFQGSLFAGLIPELEERIADILEPRLTAAFRAGMDTYVEEVGKPPSETAIFKLTFWLLTGKVFFDRGHPKFASLGQNPTPGDVLERVAAHYKEEVGRLLNGATREAVFSRIWTKMDFRNLSVESLSQIWSRTLVTPATRKRLGIHRTRRSIVDYIVERVPFEDFGKDECHVLEPCAGSASFLIAAMDRMRDEFTFDSPIERHSYFKRQLAGFERDPFGVEISRLCLALSDYPNPNHWGIEPDNVFTSDKFPAALRQARVVLCNPPFRKFTEKEKQENNATLWEPPAELLRLVLENLHPDGVIGFVLPRTFINGKWFADIRTALVRRFADLEVVKLPDKGWEHADPETALLVATKPQADRRARLTYGTVREGEWQAFDWLHEIPTRVSAIVDESAARHSLVLSDLQPVWEYLQSSKTIRDVAEAHRGLRWTLEISDPVSFREIVKDKPSDGYVPGVRPRARRFFAFQVPRISYLSTRPEHKRFKAFDLPWQEPKVIINKVAKRRAKWRVAAFADSTGLVCGESFIPIWPIEAKHVKLLAAVLNGPVANAYLTENSGKGEFTFESIYRIPFPILSDKQIEVVNRLVDEYVVAAEGNNDSRADLLLRQIDATVLTAYGLPPRLERKLLDYFRGESRLVPFEFADYFPPDFEPCFSLADWLTGKPANATVERFTSRSRDLPPHILAALQGDDEE